MSQECQDCKILNSLVEEMNEVCGWENESSLHALLHIKNFIFNLKTDLKVEQKLRKNLVKKLKKLIEEEEYDLS